MELVSNCHYKIVMVVCKLYLLGFKNIVWYSKLFLIQFVIKTGNSSLSIFCLLCVFLVTSLPLVVLGFQA